VSNQEANGGSPSMGWRAFRWSAAIVIAVGVAAVRWMTAAHMHIGQWASGVPTTPGGYVFIIIAIVLLIAPEAASISIGGMKLEMLRDTKAEVEKVGERVTQLQIQQAASASSKATVDARQFIGEAAIAAGLAAAAKEGAEAPAVPADESVLGRYIAGGGVGGRVMSSTLPTSGSTVKG